MKNFASSLNKVIQWYTPEHPSNIMLQGLQDRSKNIITFSIVYALCGAIFGPLYYALGCKSGTVAIFASDAIILLSPFILKRTGSFFLAGNWIILNVFCLLGYLAIINGGQSGPSLYWNVSLPFAATILVDASSGIFWTAAVIVESFIFFALTLTGHMVHQDFSVEGLQLMQCASLVFLCIIVFILSYLYEYFNKESIDFIRSLAITDELTKLYNRRGLLILSEDRLKMAARERRHAAVIFLDIDRLKNINDTHGHKEGDAAINHVARLLKTSLRKSDIAARIGGDEFIILITEQKEGEAEGLKKRFLQNIAQFNQSKNIPYSLTVSSGICHWSPENPRDIEQMLAEADLRMYEEKRKVS